MLILASNMRRANTFYYGHPIHGFSRGAAKQRRRDFYNGYKFDPATGEGLAPEDGLGGFAASDHFVGDIELASIEYELDEPDDAAPTGPDEIDEDTADITDITDEDGDDEEYRQ